MSQLRKIDLISDNKINKIAKLTDMETNKFVPVNVLKSQIYNYANIYTKNNKLYIYPIGSLRILDKKDTFALLREYNFYCPNQNDTIYKIVRNFSNKKYKIYSDNNELVINCNENEFNLPYIPGFSKLKVKYTKNKVIIPKNCENICIKDSKNIDLTMLNTDSEIESIYFQDTSINDIQNNGAKEYTFKNSILKNNLKLKVKYKIELNHLICDNYNIEFSSLDNTQSIYKLDLKETDISKIKFNNNIIDNINIMGYISSNPIDITNVNNKLWIDGCVDSQKEIIINKLYKKSICDFEFSNLFDKQLIINELNLEGGYSGFNIGEFTNCNNIIIKKLIINNTNNKYYRINFNNSISSKITIEKIVYVDSIEELKIGATKEITIIYKGKKLNRLSTFKRKSI